MKKNWPITDYIPLSAMVDIFFVVSGYLMVKTYRKESIRELLLKKINRLYPMMIISVIEFCLFNLLFCAVNGHFWTGRRVLLSDVIINMFGMNMWVGSGFELNGPIWYISALMFCYFIFSLLQQDRIDKNIAYAFMSIFGLCLILRKEGILFFSDTMGRGLFSFFYGCVLASLVKWDKAKKAIGFLVFLFAVFIVFSFLCKENLLGVEHVIYTIIISSALIIISREIVVTNKKLGDVMKYLGSLSYSMYLLHIPTFVFMCLLFADRIDYKSHFWTAATLMIVIVHSILIQACYHYFQRRKLR